MCVCFLPTMLYSVRPLLNVSGKGGDQTLKEQLKHDEKTAVKLNERLTVSHPVRAVQVSMTGRSLQFIPCRTSMQTAAGTAMSFTEKVTDHSFFRSSVFLLLPYELDNADKNVELSCSRICVLCLNIFSFSSSHKSLGLRKPFSRESV